jgi:hypothetical protein
VCHYEYERTTIKLNYIHEEGKNRLNFGYDCDHLFLNVYKIFYDTQNFGKKCKFENSF